MIDLKNKYILSALCGFIGTTIIYLMDKFMSSKEEKSNNDYIFNFILTTCLVYGAFYFNDSKSTKQTGGNISNYSDNVTISDPKF